MKHLILIGYRGTGKTTVARLLAERLRIPAVDSDPEIGRRAGKTIADIFADHGETAFRDMEQRILAELLENERPMVLATGGGAILRPETRRRLRDGGHVIWLTAKPETVLARMQADESSKTTRPNLTNLAPLEEIRAMLRQRHELYGETAHSIVETDDRDLADIVEEILDAHRKWTSPAAVEDGA